VHEREYQVEGEKGYAQSTSRLSYREFKLQADFTSSARNIASTSPHPPCDCDDLDTLQILVKDVMRLSSSRTNELDLEMVNMVASSPFKRSLPHQPPVIQVTGS